MQSVVIERAIIVKKETELDSLIQRFNTVPQARFYIEHAGQNFDRIEADHKVYNEALSKTIISIPANLKRQVVELSLIPQFTFSDTDIVIAVGQDGVVSNVAKYLDDQPLMGINPNKTMYDGILLLFDPDTIKQAIEDYLAGKLEICKVTLAEAITSDGQQLLAFNDFFIGAKSHVSARYEIGYKDILEVQSSSGIIVSTGAGSTGWLKSIYLGAKKLVTALGGNLVSPVGDGKLAWDTKKIPFIVREPFPSQATGTEIASGMIDSTSPLIVKSRMAIDGVIFSDGVESDFINFNTGMTVTITIAAKTSTLVLAK